MLFQALDNHFFQQTICTFAEKYIQHEKTKFFIAIEHLGRVDGSK